MNPPSDLDQVKSQQVEELQELFDDIVAEIEERQAFLEEMSKHGQNKEVEARMKKEIADRVGELQRIKELQQKEYK